MKTNQTFLASVLAGSIALALTACGGGGAGKALPSSPTATVSSLKTAMSKIVFTFAKTGATASAKTSTASSRSPQYLPSTIQSVAVGVSLVNGSAPSPAITPTVAAVGPSAPGCAADPNNSGNYLCTLTFALPIGSDTLTVASYDGANGTGNLVSQQLPVVTVVAAQANQFAMTLDAVPGVVALGTTTPGVPCAGTPLVCVVSAGTGPHTVPVTITDAHGTLLTSNAVAGSPTLSATSSNTATVTVSVTQNPYAVTITPASTGTGTATLTFVATPANAGDGLTTTQMSAAISLNPTPGTLTSPLGLTVDSGGNLWATNYFAGNVLEYAGPSFAGGPVFAVNDNNTPNSPSGLVFDANKNLYVADYGGSGVINVYPPPYANTPTTTFATGGGNPFQMAFDASGNLFVLTGPGIQVFSPPFTSSSVPSFTITSGVSNTGFGLAFDASGNLWYHDQANGLEEYSPPFSGSSVPVLTIITARGIGEMAFDGGGNLYVANYNQSRVLEFSPPFTGASTPAQTLATAAGYGLAVSGTDLFLADFNTAHISEYSLPLTGASSPVLTLAGQRSSNVQSLPIGRAKAP